MGSTYTYIVGLFGLIFFAIILLIQIQMVETFDVWVVTNAYGYDANILTFFQQLLFYWPVVGLFGVFVWGFNEFQKDKSGFK